MDDGGCVGGEVGDVVKVPGITLSLPTLGEKEGEGVEEVDWEADCVAPELRLCERLALGDPDKEGVGEAVKVEVGVKLPPGEEEAV